MHLTQLGITKIATWRYITSFRNGLVLIAGSEGAGKTMTLNATVHELQALEKCTYARPDRLDWRPSHVNHVETGSRGSLGFAADIKAFMRADPDVIILDEIHDTAAANKAIQAAEAGHLVIATINAESLHLALHRLLALGVKLEDLEVFLRGILFQVLVQTPCKKCYGTDCESCLGKGRDGRTLASQIVLVRTAADVGRIINQQDDNIN